MTVKPFASRITRYCLHLLLPICYLFVANGCGQNVAAPPGARQAASDKAGAEPDQVKIADLPGLDVDSKAPADTASGSTAKTPLIRGIGEVLDSNPALKDDLKNPLREQLQQADDILSGIKSQNRAVLKEVNRQQRTRRSSPNIVMIVIHDLALTDLACYGNPAIKTPNIDGIAAVGTRFTQFYAGSPDKIDANWCLATGHSPDESIARSESSAVLTPETVTIAETMWQAGYTTGVFGDWGVLGPQGPATPQDQGYEEWLGTFQAVDKSPQFPETVLYNGRPIKFTKNADGQQGQAAQDFYIAEAVDFMARSFRQHPLFLQLHLSIDGDSALEADLEWYADEPWPESRKRRAAALTRIDRDIGKLLQKLSDLKQIRNTVYIVTSDVPGPPATDIATAGSKPQGALRGAPGELYEAGLRIPLILAAAGRIPQKFECPAVAAAWDLAPTIYELVAAQQQPPRKIGQSLMPSLKEKAALPGRFLSWQRHGQSEIAARWKNWKAVRPAGSDDFELYDLEADAGETHNIVKQHPEVIAEIQKRLAPVQEQAKR